MFVRLRGRWNENEVEADLMATDAGACVRRAVITIVAPSGANKPIAVQRSVTSILNHNCTNAMLSLIIRLVRVVYVMQCARDS